MALTLRVGDVPILRELVTPEGVPLTITLASIADRIAAFAIDCVVIALTFVVGALALCAFRDAAGAWVPVLVNALAFVLVNGYFIIFELRTSGQTPGKRAVGIRVLSRQGGPLRADAVIARNLVRDVEFFLPLVVLCFRDAVFPDSSAAWVLACAWLLVLAAVPAFNRDGLRVGDLVGGTWVARSPKTVLRRDLLRRATAATPAAASRAGPTHEFTGAQLDVYGILELQALEDVLRDAGHESRRLRSVVAGKIARKIKYAPPANADADEFLRNFYAALRAHHERRMLFGERKEKKDA